MVLLQLLSIHDRAVGVTNLGVLLLCSQVHRDPHACATRYLVPGMGFQNINTPGSSAETAGQNTGSLPDERYIAMRNRSHFGLFSSEDRYIYCERCRSVFYTLHPSDERQTAALGASHC